MPSEPLETHPEASLRARTLASLETTFARLDHRPSPAHWAALSDIASTLEDMARGTCPPKVMLSSCDPGCGKTQAVAHFARTLVTDQAHRHVGMLICVGRLTEIDALLADLALPENRVATFTSTSVADTMARCNAQILITTQQMVERRCGPSVAHPDGQPFAATTEFHYQGHPRRIRVWDEAWLPGVAVSLNRYDLADLLRPLCGPFPRLTDAVEELFGRLKETTDGDILDVPDIETTCGVTLHDALGALQGGREDQRAALTGLFILSGHGARVRRDGPYGNAALTYQDTLPEDLAPLLVLDASGRVRTTYADVERHRGQLFRLKTAEKDYSPLTVHVWHTAGSKSGWQRRGDRLAEGIARTILTKPDEEWLVVHHLPGHRVPDVPEAVRQRLPTAVHDRVKFLTWGRHQATNEYQQIGNVILAGTLFMRPSYYTALAHLAQGKPVGRHSIAEADIAETTAGEHRNLLLQAVCRCRVRRLNGDQCLPADAYVIAAPASGIPASLRQVFPGCQVRRWEPFERSLSGKLRDAVECVEGALAIGIDPIPYKLIQSVIGVDRRNFGKLVSGRPEWLDTLAGLGVEITRIKGGSVAVRALPDAIITDRETPERACHTIL